MSACAICESPAAKREGYARGTILTEDLCFRCNHWLALHQGREPVLVVDGRAHVCGIYRGTHAGFKGRTFRLARLDCNMEVKTSDLNSVGQVPEEWRHHFPDNATFIWRNA